MSFIRPTFRHPNEPTNSLGYICKDYEGVSSTLCAGCGHDSITNAITQACFELAIEPHRVAKLSGIGCSSKTPTYFLGKSHGFNSVHGRMPSIATGANLANKDLLYIGVSGDGDTASIGMGQFAHVIRRNLNLTYIVMNNGCYGLTKGQNSATTDIGSASRKGTPNSYPSIDLCDLAITLGSHFVARSFSGDKEQLIPLIKAAIAHKGLSFIDVISPCVTFNNTPTSTKSFDHVREHAESTGQLDYIPYMQEISDKYQEGEDHVLTLHDGGQLIIHKQHRDTEVSNAIQAKQNLATKKASGHILTGLIYADAEGQETHDILGTCDAPLNTLKEEDLSLSNEALEAINASLR